MNLQPNTAQSEEKRRILVADDEAVNRELLRELLRGEYEVICVEDGQCAMETIRRNGAHLSLVMLDLHMPILSGMEILRQMKKDALLRNIPVIVVTSDLDAEIESLRLGANDFISKPYPPTGVILARVNRMIELAEERALIAGTEYDPLTGLYNREFFFFYAAQLDEESDNTAMDAVVIDIHQFHMINERYGKSFADGILRDLAGRLHSLARSCGGVVCRREADTFLVYWPHREDYSELIDSLADGIHQEGAEDIRIHLRMGVYAQADKSLDIERRFDRAQSASDILRGSLVKAIGYYDDVLHERELYAAQLIEDFPAALRERQFTIHYQPKFDIRSPVPVLASAEALVRWQHPKLGMISPGIFIPLFEENGLIRDLDLYVWRLAAAQIEEWKRRFGFSVPVSVNVSRVDMYDPQLIESFRRLLREFDLNASDLLLEITESAYTQDSQQMIQTVNLLRAEGFRIEMDDFGTGYSSLNMISSLPIDALKLDMQFIRNAFRDGRDTRLIEVIIEIAEYLAVPVIAEGVETREQLLALKAMGCHLVQGYYFSKPLPADEFEKFLLERRELGAELSQAAEPVKKPGKSVVRHGLVTPPIADDYLMPAIEWFSEQIPGGFFIYRADDTQKLVFVNNETLRIFGCSTREEFSVLTGDTFYGLVHPDDYAEIQASIERQIDDPDNEDMDFVEYRIIRKDGSVRWVDDYGHLAELPGYGKVFYVFIGDITDKRRSRQEGRRRENLYRRMQEKQDAAAEKSLAVLRANLITGVVGQARGRELYDTDYAGASLAECIEARAASIVSEEDRAAYKELFCPEALLDGYENGDEDAELTCLCRRGGRECFVTFTGRVLSEPGSGDQILFVFETESARYTNKKNCRREES